MHFTACHAFHCLASVHCSLLCLAISFTHYGYITLQGFAALNTFHFILPPFLSAFCSPPAALFGSPAGRCGLRLNYFVCLHFVLAIKAVASCSAFQAVIVFVPSLFSTDKNKNPASLPLLHMLYTAYRPFVSTTLAQLAGASQSHPSGRNPITQATQLQPTGCLFCSWLL